MLNVGDFQVVFLGGRHRVAEVLALKIARTNCDRDQLDSGLVHGLGFFRGLGKSRVVGSAPRVFVSALGLGRISVGDENQDVLVLRAALGELVRAGGNGGGCDRPPSVVHILWIKIAQKRECQKSMCKVQRKASN